MSGNPSETAVRVWARLIKAQRQALAAIEQALSAAKLPPLAWYDGLLELERAGGSLRPFELERAMLLAQYNLSRLLDRLEREGLVTRAPCDDDGRGQWAVITDKGRAAQARTWKVYARSIQRHVGEKLDDKAAAALADLLGRLMTPE